MVLDARVAEFDQLVSDAEAQAAAQISASVQAIITRTEKSVFELSEQTNEVLQEAAAAKNDLNELQRLIQSVPGIEDLTQTIEQEAAALATSLAFQNTVASRALEQMAGLVAAFDLPAGCPAGWVEFEAGAGRFIIGTDGGKYTLPYVGGKPEYKKGGSEEHILKPNEMPSHNHEYMTYSGNAGEDSISWGSAPKRVRGETSLAGGGDPHNNMPPYIALYFCKKEG